MRCYNCGEMNGTTAQIRVTEEPTCWVFVEGSEHYHEVGAHLVGVWSRGHTGPIVVSGWHLLAL